MSRRARLTRMLRHPLQHIGHRRRWHTLAGPGHAGFAGGVFNPGAVTLDDGTLCLLYKGQALHWRDALASHPERFLEGAAIMQRKAQGSATPAAPRTLTHEALPPGTAAEDYRLFRAGDRVLVNHALVPLATAITGREDKQALSELDPATGRLTYLYEPTLDFATTRREKNWLFFCEGDATWLLYSFAPLRILRACAEAGTYETVVCEELDAPFADPGALGSPVSFSTNPVVWDAAHLLVVVHQKIRSPGMRRYLHWPVLLSRSSLRPVKISRTPLFDGLCARGRVPGVLFVTAVVARGQDFVFLCGEGDSYVSQTVVSRAALQARLADR